MGCSNPAGRVIKSEADIEDDNAPGYDLNATLHQINPALDDCAEQSPFLLENEGAYQAWRARKLKLRGQLDPNRVFALGDDGLLAPEQLQQARLQIDAHNFVLFRAGDDFDKSQFLALNRQFGLRRLDANPGADGDRVTSLRMVDASDRRAQYIPYTNRALNWHTDGYYNPRERTINAFALFCMQQAERGGGNHLFDHELMYILIRDRAPDSMAALMENDLMRIPPNVQGRRIIRDEESGPVFSLRPGGSGLQMRYTSRPHNIVWKSGQRSQKALNLVREILMDGVGVVDLRLERGQGMICSNILHGRQAFHDRAERPGRLIYRARYCDAIDFDGARGDGSEHDRDA